MRHLTRDERAIIVKYEQNKYEYLSRSYARKSIEPVRIIKFDPLGINHLTGRGSWLGLSQRYIQLCYLACQLRVGGYKYVHKFIIGRHFQQCQHDSPFVHPSIPPPFRQSGGPFFNSSIHVVKRSSSEPQIRCYSFEETSSNSTFTEHGCKCLLYDSFHASHGQRYINVILAVLRVM